MSVGEAVDYSTWWTGRVMDLRSAAGSLAVGYWTLILLGSFIACILIACILIACTVRQEAHMERGVMSHPPRLKPARLCFVVFFFCFLSSGGGW